MVVDEDAALASGGDFPAENDRLLFRINAIAFQYFGDKLLGPSFNLENGRDDGAIGASADHVGGSFVTEQQGESVDQDGFPSTGFAG